MTPASQDFFVDNDNDNNDRPITLPCTCMQDNNGKSYICGQASILSCGHGYNFIQMNKKLQMQVGIIVLKKYKC